MGNRLAFASGKIHRRLTLVALCLIALGVALLSSCLPVAHPQGPQDPPERPPVRVVRLLAAGIVLAEDGTVLSVIYLPVTTTQDED